LLRNRCAIYPGITVRFAPELLCDLTRILHPPFDKENEVFYLFDALSFFIKMYKTEESNTFDEIQIIDGRKYLNDEQFAIYDKKQKDHAKFVVKKFNLTDEKLFSFVKYLLDYELNYEREEKNSLSQSVKYDLYYLRKLFILGSGLSSSEIEKEMGERNGKFVKNQYRHLDTAQKIYDYSLEALNRLTSEYNEYFPDYLISSNEIESLLKFIERSGLFIIPYSIFDTDEIFNDPQRFRKTSLFIALSNLTIGFENFLWEIILLKNENQKNEEKHQIYSITMFTMITVLFPEWKNVFDKENSKQKSNKINITDFINNVYTSPELTNILKAFLITYKVRNFTHHIYEINNLFYDKFFHIAYKQIIYCFFYSWVFANREGIIDMKKIIND